MHVSLTVADTIVQQSLAWLLNSHRHDCSTVTGTILHQSLARFFHSHGKIFSFFYAGRIVQQWRSLLKNRAMYQEYGTWSEITFNYFKLQSFIKSSHYPDIWKKSNFIPVHKKKDKQLNQNYRSISLLPIFGKIFEKSYLQ